MSMRNFAVHLAGVAGAAAVGTWGIRQIGTDNPVALAFAMILLIAALRIISFVGYERGESHA